jgi:hypothetical protein
MVRGPALSRPVHFELFNHNQEPARVQRKPRAAPCCRAARVTIQWNGGCNAAREDALLFNNRSNRSGAAGEEHNIDLKANVF